MMVELLELDTDGNVTAVLGTDDPKAALAQARKDKRRLVEKPKVFPSGDPLKKRQLPDGTWGTATDAHVAKVSAKPSAKPTALDRIRELTDKPSRTPVERDELVVLLARRALG